MPNVDAPHGFRPIRTVDGGCIIANEHTLSSTNGSIGIGDLVVVDTNGVVTGRAAAAAAAGTVLGVSAEPKAANAGGTILVWDSPNIVFEGQVDDTTGTATAQTCVYANIEIINTAPSGGISQQELDESSAAVTATLPFKIIGLHKRVGNAFGQFNCLEVVLNKSVHRAGGDGATGI
jgi:hypothetical protein